MTRKAQPPRVDHTLYDAILYGTDDGLTDTALSYFLVIMPLPSLYFLLQVYAIIVFGFIMVFLRVALVAFGPGPQIPQSFFSLLRRLGQ